MSLLTSETEPRTAPGTVEQAAAYLDDVVLALSAAGIRTSSVEIDARRPLTGRLVVTCAGHPETLVLDWHRDTGWWLARRSRAGARPGSSDTTSTTFVLTGGDHRLCVRRAPLGTLVSS